MSKVTIEAIRVNIPKFREIRGSLSLAEHAVNVGVKPDMLSKIERGVRWKSTLEKFAEFCMKTNQEPNSFFEITKKTT